MWNAIAVEDIDPKDRFVAARKDLRDLIENYTEISSKGGDAVRSKLGTQGLKSNLFGIQKVLKILIVDAEDIVEYTESMNEFNAYYYQAEGAAYQSLFIEHSSATGTPESLLKTAKTDIVQMEKYMDDMAVQLKFWLYTQHRNEINVMNVILYSEYSAIYHYFFFSFNAFNIEFCFFRNNEGKISHDWHLIFLIMLIKIAYSAW